MVVWLSPGPPSAGPLSADPPPPDPPLPDRPKFRAFFPSPATNFVLFLSHSKNVHVWAGCGVNPRRLRGRRGFTRQPVNSNRAHLTAPVLPNTTKKTREDTNWWKTEKKREILGPPPFGARFFWVLRPTLRAMTHTRSRNGLAKIGFGQNGRGKTTMAQMVLAKVGPFRRVCVCVGCVWGSWPHLAKPHLAQTAFGQKKIRIWSGHFRDRWV